MTSTQFQPPASLVGRPRRRLSDRVTFVLLASLGVTYLAGSAAPTPLYSRYQAAWGFSPITTTVIFGVYALAVLVALLVVGGLSDHLGRRPVLIVATAVQALTMVGFSLAGGVPELLLARVVQGLSTGAALGAIGAALLDVDRRRGAIAGAVSAPVGTAIGAVGAGLFVQFLPAPAQLVYLVLAALFAVQTVALIVMRETVSARPGALASLKIDLSLPPAVRGPLLRLVPALIGGWALAGFYGALAPSVLRTLSGSSALLLGGLGLFVAAGSGAVAVFAFRTLTPVVVMRTSAVTLLAGMAVVLLGLDSRSVAVFFIGTVIAGVAFGGALQGTLRTLTPLVEAHQRAGLVSVVFVLAYLAMGLPAVIGGFLVVHGGGILPTAREYVVAVLVLAVLAVLTSMGRRRPVALPPGC